MDSPRARSRVPLHRNHPILGDLRFRSQTARPFHAAYSPQPGERGHRGERQRCRGRLGCRLNVGLLEFRNRRATPHGPAFDSEGGIGIRIDGVSAAGEGSASPISMLLAVEGVPRSLEQLRVVCQKSADPKRQQFPNAGGWQDRRSRPCVRRPGGDPCSLPEISLFPNAGKTPARTSRTGRI